MNTSNPKATQSPSSPAEQVAPVDRTPRPAAWLVGLVLVILLGGWARVTNLRSVFPPSGEVELVPADSHYYIRFAQLQARSFPRFRQFDPFVNYPTGAHIYWPPIHTWIVAAALWLNGDHAPERAAAWVDPAIALLELILLAWLAVRTVGLRRALVVVLLLSWVPMAIESGALGNADHHVHEPFAIAAVCLALGAALHLRSGRWAWATGALLGASRALVPMAFGFIPLAAVCFPLAAWLGRREQSKGEWGSLSVRCGLLCSAILTLGLLAFGRPRSVEYEFWSWFQPLFALAAFTGAAAVCDLIDGQRKWRWELPVALLSGLPLIPEVLRALGHLGRSDPLLAVVVESAPLYRDLPWLRSLLGVVLVLLPVSWIVVTRAVVRRRAVEAVPALVASLVLSVAALVAQARFAQALVGAAAVLIGGTLPCLERTAFRRAWVAALGIGAITLFPSPKLKARVEPVHDVLWVRPTLRWIREHTPPAAADPLGNARPSYGIAASYLLGHFINLWAERPAIASTFSQTEEHTAGNRRAGALLAAEDDEEAYRLARDTGARYVLATPSSVIVGFRNSSKERSLLYRLLDHAAMGEAPEATTAHFRLVFESSEQRARAQGGSYARLFEVVPGALLKGTAEPGAHVEARLSLRASGGEPLNYVRVTTADPRGEFAVRVAYAAESPYVLSSGGRSIWLTVPDDAILEGKTLEVGVGLTPQPSSSR